VLCRADGGDWHAHRFRRMLRGVATLLWILAVVLVVLGIFRIFRGDLIMGIILIVVGLLVGPGGVSIFT
jgi:Zn-dependent membrane protease YugP